MTADKENKIAKFAAKQEELKNLANNVPKGWATWDYVKTVHYKKVIKDCDKFLKLKASDDDKAFIRMDNHLADLKRFY